MQTGGWTRLKSRDATSHPFSTTSGMPEGGLLLRHARKQTIGLQVAVGDDKTLTRKGGCGERGS
jgi:hypothetical protein